MSVKSKEAPLNFETAREPVRTSGNPSALELRSARWLLTAMEGAPLAFEFWDGQRVQVVGGEPEVLLRFKDRKTLWSVLTNPDLNLGEAYSLGKLEVEGDLVRLAEIGATYRPDFLAERSPLARLVNVFGKAKPNSLSGSRDNIHHHYDLSNDFYRLWLDRDHMQYTCAYFEDADKILEHAQSAKLHHVCRKLRLKPGDEVVEAGCGWGGLGLFMAKEYGAIVRAYNISHEQIRYAREKARSEGMQDRVEYIEDDYRNADGTCDVFVSVGMLEHVGVKNYPTLGGVVDRCLREDGRGLIHSIGRNKPRPMNRWIERRIFPGAYPPSIKEMMDIFEPHGFSVLDIENLRLHYAKTLEHWLQRFEDSVDAVTQMFDDTFVRAWRLYLAGSIAAFRTGELQLFQVVFNRGTDNHIPWTREHLYE
jgi:cyclopropane-fatty-acyl-phospholipid synthase